MATYQNSIANLGVRLVITHQSPDIANNRTTINYSAYVYKTNGNPYNLLSQTPMYLTINGTSILSTTTGNYDLRSTSQQLIKSGSLTIPHNGDGTKSFSFSWNVNFTSTGYGYGNVTTSGTYTLPTIPRTSTFSVASTMNTGANYTLTINRSSTSFTHDVTYTVGGAETTIATSTTATSVTVNIPHSLFNRYPSHSSVTGTINVKTKNGSSLIGVKSQSVNINLPTNFKPSVSGLSYENTRYAPMTSANQLIRGISRLTLKASEASGVYSSTIAGYEFRYKRENGNYEGVVSSSTNSFQYGVFLFPNSGSEVLTIEARVKDSRGRYSDWKSIASAVRVHFYQPPSIGNIRVWRTGANNTSLNVERNYKVTPLYTGGGTTNNNTALLTFETRELGGTESTDNGANSSEMSLTKRNGTLDGTFAANKSYEVRAVLKDSIQTVYGSWIRVSTESLPMTLAPNGIGVGKAHSGGSYNLEVGSGGVNSEGAYKINGSDIQNYRLTTNDGYTFGGGTVDFNSISKTSIDHMSGSAPNNPFQTWGLLYTMGGNGSNCTQLFICRDGNRDVAVRSKTNGSWTGWKTLMQKESIELRDNQDLNNLTNTGRYYSNYNAAVSTMANTPDNNAGWIDVVDTGGMVYQMWYSYYGNNVFFRRKYQTHWSSWANLNGGSNNAPVVKKTATGTSYRYEDGTQIIYGSSSFSTSSLVQLTFPEAFKSSTKPMITLTVEQNDRWKGVLASVITNTSTGFSASVMNHEQQALASFNVHYVAHGQWK